MAASPGTAEPPESSDKHSSSHPTSSHRPHPTQESPSLTTAAPPEMPNPDNATPVPPPPAEQSTAEHSEADKTPPAPIVEAEPPPSHPPPEAAPAVSSGFEAIPAEKLASPSPLPDDVAVEVSPEVAASASAPSPSPTPSPQIVGASPADAPQPPPPPRTPPATTAGISMDPSTTETAAMASQDEAARPSPAPETMDTDPRTAPAPLTPSMENGIEGSLPHQQPRSPSLEVALTICEKLEPAQPLPLQPCHPTERTDASPEAAVDEVVEWTLEKAAGSLPVLEATDREDMDIKPGMLPGLEIGSEEMLSQQQLQPPCPEMAPTRGKNSKSVWPPKPPPTAESTYGRSNAASNEVSGVASEEAIMALEFGTDRSSQESEQTLMTSRMEAGPCSLEMAPPGFEDFKSQWLPLPPATPPSESTDNVVQVTAINPVGMAPDAATVEGMEMEMGTSPGLLPPSKSGAEVRSQQPLLGSCSSMMEAAPCSPDMPPPGFENCKSSWLLLPTLPPICETTDALPDVASTKAVACVEKAYSVPALETTDVEADTERCRLPLLKSGTGSTLQGPPPRSPSPTMGATPCSPGTTPPGFENMKAMHVTSKEAPQSSSALEEMALDMDATPSLAPVSESEAGKSLPSEFPVVSSHVAQHTACSLMMVPSGSENVESTQLPPPTAVVIPLDEIPDVLADAGTMTVTMEEVCHALPVTGAPKEANGSILPLALANGSEDPLPHLEPQASSAAVHASPTSPEINPTSFENSKSSQHTSHFLSDTINPSAHASANMHAIVKSDKTSLPLSPLLATDTDMVSATLQQSPLKSEERSLPQPEQHPSSPSVKDTSSSEVAPPGYENLDSSEQLPPPPPLGTKFEMGQMVCGHCRRLLAYPRGAVHVQCFGCSTINLVLEEHQVGKVYCGRCDTLLMYPFGAPAVKCSNCLFVTEIGERNVRPRISKEQCVASPARGSSPHNQVWSPW